MLSAWMDRATQHQAINLLTLAAVQRADRFLDKLKEKLMLIKVKRLNWDAPHMLMPPMEEALINTKEIARVTLTVIPGRGPCSRICFRDGQQMTILGEVNEAIPRNTYCAFCGFEVPHDPDGRIISGHIKECEKHPLRAVEAKLALLESQVLRWYEEQDGGWDELCGAARAIQRRG